MFKDLRALLAIALLLTALVVVGFLALGVGAVTVSLVTATAAKAECDFFHCEPARRRYRAKKKRERYYRPPAEIIWERTDSKRTPECQPKVRIVSTEHQSCEAALNAGRKSWAGAVQWEFGGQYMNLDNAREVETVCDQANDMASASGIMSEVGGKLGGKEGVNVRYEILARPCRRLLEHVEGMR